MRTVDETARKYVTTDRVALKVEFIIIIENLFSELNILSFSLLEWLYFLFKNRIYNK